ncbi:unnamed protein product [Triticum turgidum subsp. durum]|uniref:BAHD acyltransferase DCR n=1 Tax=Triticum turgidum subsp. durum TaxID=4567 RepID=A0A9R0R1R6_TRITD|nr:unnamed protein product [Triticum turgidum subsp. durum]
MAVDNGDAAMAVAVTGTRTVAPAKTKVTLATFDLPYITFYYNQKLLLYRLPQGAADFQDVTARMADALGDALAYFYPLAGRIRPSALPIHNRAMARSVRVGLTLPASAEAHEKTDPNGPKKPLVARVFSFPEPVVARIKAAANAALPPGAKPFSAFQSLGAHIWRSVSRARELGPADITVFAVFADCRARLDPPVPATYFGNLIQAVFTGVPAGMLLGGPPELAAGMLQKAIGEHDAAAVTRRLDEYEAAPKLFHYSDAGPNCVAVGSSPRFRVYDVDFGFGRPERVRSGGNNKFDGMVYLYPGRGGDSGGIDVELALQPEPMQRLEKDEEFLQVAAA